MKEEEPIGGESGLSNSISIESVESDPSTVGHVVHRDKDRLVLGTSLAELIPGILQNEAIE